jgi:hypothetical protein
MNRVLYVIVKGQVLVTVTFISLCTGSDSSTSPKASPPLLLVALAGLTARLGVMPWPFNAMRSRLFADLHTQICRSWYLAPGGHTACCVKARGPLTLGCLGSTCTVISGSDKHEHRPPPGPSEALLAMTVSARCGAE